MKKILPAEIKVLLVPVFFLVSLLFLVFLVFNFGLPKILSQGSQLQEAKKTENILIAKEAFLMGIEGVISSQANLVLFALPDENSGLMAVSQLKNLSLAKAVAVGNFKIGSQVSEKGIAKVSVGFDVEGNLPSLFDFIKSISTLSPLTSIEKVKINQSGQVARANILLAAYWAELPAKLPPLAEPIKEFSKDEKEMIARLGSLTPPEFLQILPSAPSGRQDPFSL